MTALTACRTCSHQISPKAKSCPNCGERKPAKKAPSKILKYALLGFLGLMVFNVLVETITRTPSATSGTGSTSTSSSDWGILRETSKMDGSTTLILQKDAKAPVEAWLKEMTPSIRIQCKEGKTSVLLITDAPFASVVGAFGKAQIRTRIGEGAPSESLWSKSTDGEAAFAPNPVSFVRKLKNAKTLNVEFNPHNATLALAEFDLTGIEPHIEELAKTCKWAL